MFSSTSHFKNNDDVTFCDSSITLCTQIIRVGRVDGDRNRFTLLQSERENPMSSSSSSSTFSSSAGQRLLRQRHQHLQQQQQPSSGTNVGDEVVEVFLLGQAWRTRLASSSQLNTGSLDNGGDVVSGHLNSVILADEGGVDACEFTAGKARDTLDRYVAREESKARQCLSR
jgi:hypothetical protein